MGLWIGTEEVPGFAELFEAGTAAVSLGIEAERHAGGQDRDGDYVPEVEGDNVGDEEIDVGGGVVGFAGLVGVHGLDIVTSRAQIGGAFDLNAPEALAVVEDEVVALAVSPGLGELEAESFRFEEEGGFGTFSGALGVASAVVLFWAVVFGGLGLWRFCRDIGSLILSY